MKRLLVFLILALGTSPSGAISAPLYVYKQSNGSIKFSSKKPSTGVDYDVFSGNGTKFSSYRGTKWFRGSALYRERYNSIIDYESRLTGLDPALVRAVIHAESSFNPVAVSPKGALGLMQLMPATARQWGVADPFSPQQNIRGGTKHLAMLLDRLQGNVRLALAAYNAGLGAVKNHGGIPPYRETQDYVSKVLSLQSRYQVG